MSGQPYRYASDVANYRQEYMNTLGLRTDIDKMNYQANKNYIETGVLPPKSQMKDNRDTSDILMDNEKLKLSIIKDFKPIASPNMAMAMIQQVIASPLNGDGSFFIWLAQNAPELVVQIKKKYKFGIAGNQNDVATMVLFLQTLYSKTKDMNASIKTVFDRPVNSGGGMDPRDFTELKRAYDDIYLRLISMRALSPVLQKIKDKFEAMSAIFVPANRYIQIRNMFLTLSTVAPTNPGYQQIINSGGFKQWIDYNDSLPQSSALRALLDQLKKSELNTNPSLSLKILENILSMLPSVRDSVQIDNTANAILAMNPPPPGAPPGTQGPPLLQTAATTSATPLVITTANDRLTSQTGDAIAATVLDEIHQIWDANQSAPTPTFNFENPVFDNVAQHFTQAQFNMVNYTPVRIKEAIKKYTQNNLNHVGQLISGSNAYEFMLREVDVFKTFMRQEGMTGFGLKRRGRPKGSGLQKPITERIDTTKGIKQGSVQIPFGKYIINKNKLDNDIFYILDAKKGYCVKGYPQKKISKALGSVVRTIIGGSVPKFEDLQNLDDADKEYLHKVASKAGVLDKLSIPSPSKDQTEKDIHEFEVMKGEILAGNDSTELIKKFKLLLLKLSKAGSIPKREATELMEDLISLGY